MSSKYLLPCSCGRKIAIQVVQSGQTVECECGRRLDVPTMLQIRSLEPVEEEASPRAHRSWGARQGLVLLGGLIVVAAGCVAAQLYFTRPRPLVAPSQEQVHKAYTGSLSLRQTFEEWEMLRTGPDRFRAERIDQGYGSVCANYRRWMTVAVVIGLLGVACAASGLLVPGSPRAERDGPEEPE